MRKMNAQLISFLIALIIFPFLAQANSGDFSGGVAIGSSYAGINTASTNGLIVQGNVGIGTTAPVNKMDIIGAAAVGFSAPLSSAPSNGLIVKGKVGIGTTSLTNNANFEVYSSTDYARIWAVSTVASGVGLIGFYDTNTNSVGAYLVSGTNNGALAATNNAGTYQSSNLAWDTVGHIAVGTLATATSNTLCYNTSTISGVWNTLSLCSSARRYKENVQDSSLGLKEILAMRPITFDWKANKKDNWEKHDFGFIAEDMEKINPLFATYNNKGEIEGVRYMQLTAVEAKAIQELYDIHINETRELKSEIKQLHDEVEQLKNKPGANK